MMTLRESCLAVAVLVALFLVNGCGKRQVEDSAPAEGARAVHTPEREAAKAEPAAATDQAAAPKESSPLANAASDAPPGGTGSNLPKLVDLGAHKCIPCKMMAPILEELTKEYAGRMVVEFIDVWENPAAGQKYGVRVIPTQIFYGPDGKELFRHEGFFSKEDILGKWKEFGHTFPEPSKEQ